MVNVPIRSRAGNWSLLVAGLLFAAISAGLLALSVISTWQYAGLIDHLVHVILVFTAISGATVAFGARQNLRGRGESTRAGIAAHAR